MYIYVKVHWKQVTIHALAYTIIIYIPFHVGQHARKYSFLSTTILILERREPSHGKASSAEEDLRRHDHERAMRRRMAPRHVSSMMRMVTKRTVVMITKWAMHRWTVGHHGVATGRRSYTAAIGATSAIGFATWTRPRMLAIAYTNAATIGPTSAIWTAHAVRFSARTGCILAVANTDTGTIGTASAIWTAHAVWFAAGTSSIAATATLARIHTIANTDTCTVGTTGAIWTAHTIGFSAGTSTSATATLARILAVARTDTATIGTTRATRTAHAVWLATRTRRRLLAIANTDTATIGSTIAAGTAHAIGFATRTGCILAVANTDTATIGTASTIWTAHAIGHAAGTPCTSSTATLA